jgi:hypothetical protein
MGLLMPHSIRRKGISALIEFAFRRAEKAQSGEFERELPASKLSILKAELTADA